MRQPPDGFVEFVAARSAALVRTAWLLTGDLGIAEDLVQTALAKAWPRWESIGTEAAVREAYVRRVLATTFLAGRRRAWVVLTRTGELPELVDARDEMERADLRDALVRALRRLPARQRATIVLRYFDDLSEAATAEAMGCSVGTVKTHASRGLAALNVALRMDRRPVEEPT